MPNYFLPGVGAYSNNTSFQNIVTWSTTSRTLRANFKLFTGFVCSYCSNLLQKDHINMQKVNFRPQATYTISLRYFLVLCVISAVLLSIINKFIVRERQKNKCSDSVTELFSFISRDLLIVNCTLHVYLRNSTNNLKLEFAAIAVKRKNIKNDGQQFPSDQISSNVCLEIDFSKNGGLEVLFWLASALARTYPQFEFFPL